MILCNEQCHFGGYSAARGGQFGDLILSWDPVVHLFRVTPKCFAQSGNGNCSNLPEKVIGFILYFGAELTYHKRNSGGWTRTNGARIWKLNPRCALLPENIIMSKSNIGNL